MKIYVDEVPALCEDCVFANPNGYCILNQSASNGCPLEALNDYEESEAEIEESVEEEQPKPLTQYELGYRYAFGGTDYKTLEEAVEAFCKTREKRCIDCPLYDNRTPVRYDKYRCGEKSVKLYPHDIIRLTGIKEIEEEY